MNESPAARRFRLLAPLVALLALMALMMAPGIIAEFRDGATSIGATTQGSTRLADGGEERGAVPEL